MVEPGTDSASAEQVPPGLPRAAFWTPLRAGIAIALAATAFQLAAVNRYAMTLDSPSLLYAGERTLFWLLNPGAPNALNFPGPEPAGFKSHFDRLPNPTDPQHYPVFPAFVGSVASRVLHERLDWLDPIAGHHAGLILLNGLALLLFCLYASALLGRGAGIVATIALALFPSALAHAPNNPKDWPCAQFYGLAVLAAGVGMLRGRARHLLAAGALLGIAFSCKANAVFVLPTLLLWAPVAWLCAYRRERPVPAAVASAFTGLPYVAFAVFFVTWPWLWRSGLAETWKRLTAYGSYVISYGVGAHPTWTDYPLRALAFMTPPVVLVAALAYFVVGWRGAGQGARERLATWALLVLWTGLPLVRIAAPHSNYYDANRHFLEYIPGLCAMAGAGAVQLARWVCRLAGRWSLPPQARGAAVATLAVVGAVGVIGPVAEYHPYEVAYYNAFVGGLGGAQRRALFAMPDPHDRRTNGSEGDYWASSVRDAIADLRKIAGPSSVIAACGYPSGHPSAYAAHSNDLQEPRLKFVDYSSSAYRTADFVLISPREFGCFWREVREFEQERPILRRVERGGGLVYEILGPLDGKAHVAASPQSRYELEPHPADKVGQRLAEARRNARGRSVVRRALADGTATYEVIDQKTGAVVWRPEEAR